jgi:hypothetical protein
MSFTTRHFTPAFLLHLTPSFLLDDVLCKSSYNNRTQNKGKQSNYFPLLMVTLAAMVSSFVKVMESQTSV